MDRASIADMQFYIGEIMSIAPLMLDLDGTEITQEEKEILQHPYVGAVIFFSRNYESAEQIEQLVKQVRSSTTKEMLICVDHEGGRVQRFRSDFTELPAIGRLSQSTQQPDQIEEHMLQISYQHGWLMAAEVRAVGIDFSFAPVLDINYGVSEVIGDRSFNQNPQVVSQLSRQYIEGMRAAGMASTGKHFPGHGGVTEDSHHEIPVDKRSREAIWAADIVPFKELAEAGMDAVMPAHVIYPDMDDKPAGFSAYWLQQVLRKELAFDGVIFSDDLSMEGASVMGGYTERAEAAMDAGCDMILVCNNRAGAIEVMDKANIRLESDAVQQSMQRLNRMKGQSFMNRSALLDSKIWAEAVEQVTALVKTAV